MEEVVFVRGQDSKDVQDAIRTILKDVQDGKYAAQLNDAKVNPPANLAATTTVSQRGSGMSPNEWHEIVAVFGPVAGQMAKDIWSIVVVPRLKKLFREDSVSEKNPDQRK